MAAAYCVRLNAILSLLPSLSHLAVSGSGYHTLCALHPTQPHSVSPSLAERTLLRLPQTPTNCLTRTRACTDGCKTVRATLLLHYGEMVAIVVSRGPEEFEYRNISV